MMAVNHLIRASMFFSVLIPAVAPVGANQKSDRVDDAALSDARNDSEEWLTYGHDYAETHFSPLKQITALNVNRLGLAWSWKTDTNGGLESTPIVSNGIIYGTGTWSVVFALDARTGNFKWRWDPEVERSFGPKACCGPVNRGVALYKGKIYVGVLDGRLAALDASTGKLQWQVQTSVDREQAYSITGAPRIVKGKVIIGNGGAEYAARGYLSAYDAETGKLAWRFYTVPGDPSKPFENKALEKAAKTWHGEWWKMGGGGTVWDAFAYDPVADLLYVGTGNGGPWDRDIRSPGGGDNLYLSSILALRPDSGDMVWYYQTTPGDSWDFTATQSIVLADLLIYGRTRHVLMQAPKNGFFYVLDRLTGELLSAEPYALLNWATSVDKATGRPIENPQARYSNGPFVVLPGGGGAHNWHPMSFNPATGLVYIPGQDLPYTFSKLPGFHYVKGQKNIGNLNAPMPRPAPPAVMPPSPGFLLAWDPVAQKERWRMPYPTGFNGGSMTTAGNLVFQGSSSGRFFAYNAETGEKLWQFQTAPGIATPVTYMLDGKQYISVLAGRGNGTATGARQDPGANPPPSRMWTFVLDGEKQAPE